MRDLSIEEIKALAKLFKDDLTGECERAVRRQDSQTPFASYAAIQGKEYIDHFVRSLELAAGSRLQELLRPPRARAIHINKALRSK